MRIVIADLNSANEVIGSDDQLRSSWSQLEEVLRKMPLHTKNSDQKGIEGKHVFDPVGTNEHIKAAMRNMGWGCSVPIPKEHTCFGRDVDFKKEGLLVEVQFANYPFLLNNVARSELFIRELWAKAVIIITKCNVLPGANSMLYYEQAKNQLTKLAIFRCPIRLVGLSVDPDSDTNGIWTHYSGYYSREIKSQRNLTYKPTMGKRGSKMNLMVVEESAAPVANDLTGYFA